MSEPARSGDRRQVKRQRLLRELGRAGGGERSLPPATAGASVIFGSAMLSMTISSGGAAMPPPEGAVSEGTGRRNSVTSAARSTSMSSFRCSSAARVHATLDAVEPQPHPVAISDGDRLDRSDATRTRPQTPSRDFRSGVESDFRGSGRRRICRRRPGRAPRRPPARSRQRGARGGSRAFGRIGSASFRKLAPVRRKKRRRCRCPR